MNSYNHLSCCMLFCLTLVLFLPISWNGCSVVFSSSQYNSPYDVVVSADTSGMIEYWRGPSGSYCFPRNIKFDLKIDTDLYEFVKVSRENEEDQ